MCWGRLVNSTSPLVESSCCTIYLSVTSSPWSRSVECTRRGESVTGCDPLTAPPWKVTLSANHDYIKCHSLSISLSPSLFFSLSCPRSKLLYTTVSFKFPSKFLGACPLIHFIVSITAMCWERKWTVICLNFQENGGLYWLLSLNLFLYLNPCSGFS